MSVLLETHAYISGKTPNFTDIITPATISLPSHNYDSRTIKSVTSLHQHTPPPPPPPPPSNSSFLPVTTTNHDLDAHSLSNNYRPKATRKPIRYEESFNDGAIENKNHDYGTIIMEIIDSYLDPDSTSLAPASASTPDVIAKQEKLIEIGDDSDLETDQQKHQKTKEVNTKVNGKKKGDKKDTPPLQSMSSAFIQESYSQLFSNFDDLQQSINNSNFEKEQENQNQDQNQATITSSSSSSSSSSSCSPDNSHHLHINDVHRQRSHNHHPHNNNSHHHHHHSHSHSHSHHSHHHSHHNHHHHRRRRKSKWSKLNKLRTSFTEKLKYELETNPTANQAQSGLLNFHHFTTTSSESDVEDEIMLDLEEYRGRKLKQCKSVTLPLPRTTSASKRRVRIQEQQNQYIYPSAIPTINSGNSTGANMNNGTNNCGNTIGFSGFRRELSRKFHIFK
ncbi:hypothetical protein KGF56_004255 [Candida oxycetoniae]|uniref:Uncharacterized protein n=1 Tax=Candida oxycetoniae TaxID=497107 RepID=A0AAI9SU01_9ASCO|nr:uncharacterized protein KGF56_004255 [Candida oxycetoniae]KAI3403002.2 hypothetical protein KGF56_004255 [Candida oxycetoniae]